MSEQIQTVWLTFDDGTKAAFVGKAVAFETDDPRYVMAVQFSPAEDLPEGVTLTPVTEIADL
jgi:hypothetical protein